MTYAQTIDYLFETLPMFSRMGSAAYKKDLTNIIALCEYLGNPHLSFKTIHVGGTNGKGSVSHMLASIFAESGYKTGLYTSPHLYDFRERIRIDGAMAEEAFVVRFVEDHRAFIEKLQPSFFEITVALAFQHFAEQKVDLAVIEVGLGGRLDSTNIVQPELSIITNIGWDHMNLLGNTLTAIAGEKAGIIKFRTPVVIGERTVATEKVFLDTAAEQDAPLIFASDRYNIIHHKTGRFHAITYEDDKGEAITIETDLKGIYQLQNVRTVLAALPLLQECGWKLETSAIKDGLKKVQSNTGLMGRWQQLRSQPDLVLEVAHNVDGMQKVLEQLKAASFRQLHMVIGMVRDKDSSAVLSLLPREAFYYFTQAQIPRALPAEELAKAAHQLGLNGKTYTDVNAAINTALNSTNQDDLILVCGSIFLVGEVNISLFQQS